MHDKSVLSNLLMRFHEAMLYRNDLTDISIRSSLISTGKVSKQAMHVARYNARFSDRTSRFSTIY